MTTQRRHDDEPAPAPVRADRAAGVVLASAAGDALGAGDELGPPLDQETLVETLVGQGRRRRPPSPRWRHASPGRGRSWSRRRPTSTDDREATDDR